MTAGHKHRMITVKREGIVHRALTKPLYKTRNLKRVEPSPYPYGVLIEGERIADGRLPEQPDPREVYYLSALSVLHRWFGLTLWMSTDDADPLNSGSE